MSQRGSLSIIACLLLLHVQVGAAIQYCANASSSAYSDSTPASANLHLHHGGGSDSPAQSDGSTPKGHCAFMATCSVVLAVDGDIGVAAARIDYQRDRSQSVSQPVSLSTPPDSPPPKS